MYRDLRRGRDLHSRVAGRTSHFSVPASARGATLRPCFRGKEGLAARSATSHRDAAGSSGCCTRPGRGKRPPPKRLARHRSTPFPVPKSLGWRSRRFWPTRYRACAPTGRAMMSRKRSWICALPSMSPLLQEDSGGQRNPPWSLRSQHSNRHPGPIRAVGASPSSPDCPGAGFAFDDKKPDRNGARLSEARRRSD